MRDTNPLYYLFSGVSRLSPGVPVVVNTSFNVRGEPIVCTPEDSFRCFMGTDIDMLAIGNCFLTRLIRIWPSARYEGAFELD